MLKPIAVLVGLASGTSLLAGFVVHLPIEKLESRPPLYAPKGPSMRVLLRRADAGVGIPIRINGGYRLVDRRGHVAACGDGPETRVSVTADEAGFHWGGTALNLDWLELTPDRDGDAALEFRFYRGALRFVRTENGGIAVINALPMEDYLAGVLRGEIPRKFEPPAQRAMAIAARTYALFQRSALPDDADFHVYGGDKSQVYHGVSAEDNRALEAVRDTSGIVLTCGDASNRHIFEAFYCSTCGGVTLPASVFTGRPAEEPLHGGVRCDYAAAAGSPFLTWPDVKIGKREITRKLAERFAAVEPLGMITAIEMVRGAAGEPPSVARLIGEKGESRKLRPEELRIGVGYGKLRSGWFDVQVQPDAFVFTNGRGYGHGVGLCQYGAHGMALAGKSTSEILYHYYPSSRLVRAY